MTLWEGVCLSDAVGMCPLVEVIEELRECVPQWHCRKVFASMELCVGVPFNAVLWEGVP